MPLTSVDRPHTTSVIKVTESEQYRSKHTSHLVATGPAKYSVPIEPSPGNHYVYLLSITILNEFYE